MGFVPTMGALHAGHLSLVNHARELGADHVVMSIFVNPLQFGPDEDYGRYPRRLRGDLEVAAGAGVDTVFTPTVTEMFPPESVIRVSTGALGRMLEGRDRGQHFDGVATVLTRLMGAVGPHDLVMGQKDYQQTRVVHALIRELNLRARLLVAPIVREGDGLALSSRNARLTLDERHRALCLNRGLQRCVRTFDDGERNAERLLHVARQAIDDSVDRLHYLTARDADTLAPVSVVGRPVVMLVAARVGTVRLLDNVLLRP